MDSEVLADKARRLYAALANGDRAALDDLLHARFVGRLAEGMPFGVGGTHAGPEAMRRDGWGAIARHFQARAEPERFVALGEDQLLVTGRYRGEGKRGGAALDADFAHILTFEDGRVRELTQYTDTGRWRDAASPLSALTLEIAEGVATLRLNRPRHANAIDPDMASDLLEAATRIAETPGVRAVLIALLLASNTLPFAERLNAAIVAGALTLDDDIEAADLGGSPRVALSALTQAIAHAHAFPGEVLVLAADRRKARPGGAQELEYGDGAAAALIGRDNVLAEFLGSATLSVDFVDHFRAAGEETDYHWEERWVRDEGVSKLTPRVVAGAVRDVLDGEFDAEGRAPCQIDGGLKCFGHPVGASGIRMLYEIYLQLNGRAGARQLGDPRLGLIHNLGGQPSQNVCAVSIVGGEGV